jgi:hypothetical protein
MCWFTQDSWKMYRYTVEERVFIVRGRTGKDFQKYGVPFFCKGLGCERSCIHVIVWKIPHAHFRESNSKSVY